MFRILLFILLVTIVISKNVLRDRRFIRGTYTNTVVETKVITSWVPSSCVYVEPTLQPCRNARYMRFPNFVASGWQSITEDQSEKKAEPELETGLEATALGWAEYFGFYAPTVTVTETELQTVTAKDPRIVVTFAVKGCKPLKIPNDIDRCPDEDASRVTIQDIVPTSTVQSLQSTSTIDPHDVTTQKNARLIDLAAAKLYDDLRKSYSGELPSAEQFLEGSQTSIDDSESHKPTKSLT